MTDEEQSGTRHGHGLRRRLRSDRGTAVVEFAVLALPLFAVIFGILDFGRAMNYKTHLTSLANEAARYAIVNRDPATPGNPFPSCASVKSYLQSQADTKEIGNLISAGDLGITFDGGPSQTTSGHPVTVSVGVDFPWLSFISTEALGGSASTNLKGTATMRIEQSLTGYTGSTSC